MKKLGYVIPLGTLVVLLVAFLVTRWTGTRPLPMPIVGASDTNLPPIDFPQRDAIVTGRVVDAKGEPIARATLWLRVNEELSFTESAADGAFVFDRVQSGPRILGVVADGFAPHRFVADPGAGFERIVLDPPLPAPPSLPALARSDLRGVVHAGTAVAAGMQVCLAPRAPPETFGAPLPVRVECDEDGSFEFVDLIEGEYTVQLVPRWAANGSWPDLLRPLSGTSITPLNHASGAHESGLELTSIAASVRGKLRDGYDSPLEGALVFVAPVSDPERVWPPVASRADGSFVRGDLPPGKYLVRVRAGGDAAQLEVDLGPSEVRELGFRELLVGRAK